MAIQREGSGGIVAQVRYGFKFRIGKDPGTTFSRGNKYLLPAPAECHLIRLDILLMGGDWC